MHVCARLYVRLFVRVFARVFMCKCVCACVCALSGLTFSHSSYTQGLRSQKNFDVGSHQLGEFVSVWRICLCFLPTRVLFATICLRRGRLRPRSRQAGADAASLARGPSSPKAPPQALARRRDVRGLLAGRRLDVLRPAEVGRSSPRRHKEVRCHDVRRVTEVDRSSLHRRLLLPAFMCPARRLWSWPRCSCWEASSASGTGNRAIRPTCGHGTLARCLIVLPMHHLVAARLRVFDGDCCHLQAQLTVCY